MNQEEKKQTLLGYLFLVPSLAVFAVFMFYPLFYTVYLSFFEWNMVKPVKKFVGLANYAAISGTRIPGRLREIRRCISLYCWC